MSHKRGIFYKATISNIGGQAITGAQFSESLDPINIFQNDLLDAPAGEIAIGSTKEIIYSYDVTQADISAGVVTAVASLSADAPVEPANATISTTSISLDDGILITKQITSNPPYLVNDNTSPIKYKIIVKNIGDNTLTNVVVTDSLIDAPAPGTIQNIVDTSNLLTAGTALAHDENAILTFEYVIGADDSDITNTACVTSTEVPGPICTDPVNVSADDMYIIPAIIQIEASQGDEVFLPVLADANTLYVDWYDNGNLSAGYSNEFPSHTYNDAYTGQVKVYGTAIHWTGSFQTVLIDAPADPSIHNYWPWIKAIVDWGDLGVTHIDLQGVYGLSGGYIDPALPASVTSLSYMFKDWGNIAGYENVVIPDITNLDTSNVKGMSAMFRDAPTFNQDISNWNTSAVTGMGSMFYFAYDFNRDISSWDTGEVKGMNSMFYFASAFNNGDAAGDSNNPLNWDTSKVTNMFSMFDRAFAFDQDISSWDVSSVSTMGGMFRGTVVTSSNFNNGGVPLNWEDTSSLRSVVDMFRYNHSFNQDISSWDVSAVTNMGQMFDNASAFNNGGVALDWADTSSVENMGQMFDNATSFNQDISSWNVSAVTNMGQMFDNATSWSTANYDAALLAFAAQTLQSGVEWTNTYACREIEIPTEFTNAGWIISDGGVCV